MIKLSPTFLWISKFDAKLGVGVKVFKITMGRCLFYFWFKTCIYFCFSLGFQNLMFKSVLQCSSYFVGIYLFFGLKVHFFRGVGGINFCSFDGITIGRCVHHFFILKVWFPIKKTAAKPPAERSEANKVPCEARLIKYISTYIVFTYVLSPEGGPIVFTYVLSPEGTLQSRYWRRSNRRRSRRPSEARLIKCISTYTCNTIKKTEAAHRAKRG